jgi:hypothetical protein
MRLSLFGHNERLRRNRHHRVTLCGAGVTLLTATALAGCGGSGHTTTTAAAPLDAARVAGAIQTSVHSKRHVSATVTCPSGMPQRKDAKFYCVAQVGAHITPFRVTETGADGQVTWVGVSPKTTHLLATSNVAKAIGASIKSSKHLDAVVRCPADIPLQRGLPFACTATTRSGQAHFEVRQTDGRGHVTYHAL